MELWRKAEDYYTQAMQTEDPEKSLELYDRCIETLSRTVHQETVEKNRSLLVINIRQAEANKLTVIANRAKERAYQEPLSHQAAEYLVEAAECHAASASIRKEAASIAREIGFHASSDNMLGSAYQDEAFYHSYRALEAQHRNNMENALAEYEAAVKFLETALEHFDRSLDNSMHEETENNRVQCREYYDNFQADLREARTMKQMREIDTREMFDHLLDRAKEIAGQPVTASEKLLALCNLLQDGVPHYDWVGFYLVDRSKRELVLGPFAGEPTEHVNIPWGKGICGQAAERRRTFIAQDVSKETNYLSCSPYVQSEIVVPILKHGEIVAELDIDSHTCSPFTEDDQRFLEAVCEIASILFS